MRFTLRSRRRSAKNYYALVDVLLAIDPHDTIFHSQSNKNCVKATRAEIQNKKLIKIICEETPPNEKKTNRFLIQDYFDFHFHDVQT